jgi:trehalose synthase
MDEVPITPSSINSFTALIGERRMDQLAHALAEAQERLDGASVWHVNSTAAGGGVAEMLQSVLSYPAGADTAALALDSVTAGERLVAFSLASFADGEHRAFPRAAAAAARAGLSRSRYLAARKVVCRRW